MRNKIQKLLSFLLISLLVVSCDIINPDEPIPAIIKIDTIKLETSLGQGSKSSKITDAWVIVDEKSIGAFELPATIPILKEGKGTIKILPGIMLNGVSGTRSSNPFMEITEEEIEFIPGETNTQFETITTTYQDDVIFAIEDGEENFEQNSIIFEKYGETDTVIEVVNNSEYLLPVFGGNGCGAIFLDTTKNEFEATTRSFYTLPKTPVFIEFDYKTDNYFELGIVPATASVGKLLFIKPNDKWNKIYFNLTPFLGQYYTTEFKIYISAGLDSGKENATILLDNIKLIHE